MILQALSEHYEALASQGKIARPGWSDAKISFALCIDGSGGLERVVSLKTEQTRGKKTALLPRSISLPAPVKRTVNPRPNFLWDNPSYLLGADAKGKPQRSMECFRACRAFHHRLLDGTDSPAARALLAFFDRWDPAAAAGHPALQEDWEDLISGANLVFRYDGAFLHDDPLIRRAWQDHYGSSEGGTQMVCLVTGREGPAEAVHPSVKGLAGAQSSGAALVSFNAPAFCSYGHEQNLNAPVSKYAAFAYTAALNHLLSDREHVYRIGDTSVLFWAKSGEADFQTAFAAWTFGGPSHYDAGDLGRMLGSLLKGERVQYDETMLDPGMDFYILGLSPNAARVSVRFFLRGSFGGFLQNVQRHYDRLEIVRPANDRFDTIPLWRLLDATVNKKSRDSSPSPVMAGETARAILTDTRYPASLLNGTILRIRADHEVDRTRAAILKAYYLKAPHPEISKEVLTVSLNPTCGDPAYVLGRLFSVYESIQSDANPGINATIKDKYFNSAASIPATVFPILGGLAQKHLKKLKGSSRGKSIFYEKQIGEIAALLGTGFPARMSLPQQGAFQLGYYHQTQARYQKKEEK
nr:type I-C CRISPR-associated protein Cas8c/Csd1 [uncultured Oscillibacter sp.]